MIAVKKVTIYYAVLILTSWTLQGQAHQGSHDDAPIIACKEKKLTNVCEYNNHAGDIYRGTCRSFSDTLMCVRNKPIIKAKKAEIKEDAQKVLENSHNRKTGGTGLGLSIARTIIRHHGGDILLRNQPEGFRVVVQLP